MARTQKTYSFKVGEKFDLDDIYNIQGLAGGDWWDREGDELSDALVCVRAVKITIIVESPNARANLPPERAARREPLPRQR